MYFVSWFGNIVQLSYICPHCVLHFLLKRRARYFDPPEDSGCTCRNCGEEGHREGNCTAQKRRRPCFVCGTFEHSWRRCKLVKHMNFHENYILTVPNGDMSHVCMVDVLCYEAEEILNLRFMFITVLC